MTERNACKCPVVFEKTTLKKKHRVYRISRLRVVFHPTRCVAARYMEEEPGEERIGCLEIDTRYQSSKRQESEKPMDQSKLLRQNGLDLFRKPGRAL